MLHQVGGVANYTRHEDLALRQFYLFPDAPFMLVAHVRSLDGIRLRLDLEDNVGDIAQRHIVDMRSMAAAPAEVQAHVFLVQTREGVVDRLDQHLDVLAVLGPAHSWEKLPGGRELRLVDLQDETSISDRLVLLTQSLGRPEEERLLTGVVVVVRPRTDTARSNGRDEALDILALYGGL